MPDSPVSRGDSVFSVCDAALEGGRGEVPAGDGEERSRVAVDCPDCGAALVVVADSLSPDLRLERRE